MSDRHKNRGPRGNRARFVIKAQLSEMALEEQELMKELEELFDDDGYHQDLPPSPFKIKRSPEDVFPIKPIYDYRLDEPWFD